jgi:hypothetical protein
MKLGLGDCDEHVESPNRCKSQPRCPIRLFGAGVIIGRLARVGGKLDDDQKKRLRMTVSPCLSEPATQPTADGRYPAEDVQALPLRFVGLSRES